MGHYIASYDGAIVARPREFVLVRDVAQLQEVLSDEDRYPSPVRAKGSFHSLTECVSTDGTMVDMTGMNRVLDVDADAMTVTAEAGAQLVDVARVLDQQNLQFILNVEIGNITLGAAACCQTKDGLDNVEFGQLSSYVIEIKWVAPGGELRSASERANPELLRLVRSSYGLCGIIYEVTFRIKPLERVQFRYQLMRASALTQDYMERVIATNQALVCWTVGHTTVIQTRNRIAESKSGRSWKASLRRRSWNFLAAFVGRGIQRFVPTRLLRTVLQNIWFFVLRSIYRILSLTGGMKLNDPEKTVDYRGTPPAARYAFTYWTFPRQHWVDNLQAYLRFADEHYRRTGFRCNMPLGSYFIRQDTKAILSYTHDSDTFSIDPIHAASDRDKPQWEDFLREFNAWASMRGGVPLLNQSPFVTKPQVQQAFGSRWTEFSQWVRSVDPEGRMLNRFFRELLA
jgi:FAD/FMN-containing dehydrogenase